MKFIILALGIGLTLLVKQLHSNDTSILRNSGFEEMHFLARTLLAAITMTLNIVKVSVQLAQNTSSTLETMERPSEEIQNFIKQFKQYAETYEKFKLPYNHNDQISIITAVMTDLLGLLKIYKNPDFKTQIQNTSIQRDYDQFLELFTTHVGNFSKHFKLLYKLLLVELPTERLKEFTNIQELYENFEREKEINLILPLIADIFTEVMMSM